MNQRVATIQRNRNQFYFSLLGALVFSLTLFYMYFLTTSVVHVVLRKQAISAQSSVSSEIAELESAYIEAQHLVSDKIVATQDFNQNSDKIFVSRSVPTVAMTGRIN